VLPWVGREIDWELYETHCCLLPHAYDINQIKKDLQDGKKSKACQKCWNLEDQGHKSDRQVKNAALDFYWDRDITFIKKDAIEGNLNDVLVLKLGTSYTCNATCVSCGSGNSSSWAQLEQRMNPDAPKINYKFIDLKKLINKIDFSKIKMLSLLGGEPLYEKKNFDLLEHILELGNSNVFLSMVTNGSVKLTNRQRKILSRFKNLNFSVSIDGTERVFEYMRYPLRWDDLCQNIQFFKTITDNVSSNYTLSNLNLLYHNKTTSWFKENEINYSVNPIYNPPWLQPKSLPAKAKEFLKTELDPTDYKTFVGLIHTQQDQQNFVSMLEQVQRQDQGKQISIKDYLPEFCKMVGIN
jgi:organic radical activating enzyme